MRDYRHPRAIAWASTSNPVVVLSPNTVSQAEDVRAIVAYVAHRILRSELDWSQRDVRAAFPALQGLTQEQIDTAIADALA